MKKFLVIGILCITGCYSKAAIIYDHIEYKPVGKHYTAKWNKLQYGFYTNTNTDRLTMLYFKTPNNVIIYKGIWISKSLEAKLPMVVVRYIGMYITDIKLKQTHSLEEAIKITKKAVEQALDQKWKNNLMSNAQAMVNNPRYHRGNSIIDNNAYYEFAPYHLDAADSAMSDYIEKPKTIAAGFQSGEIKNNLDAIMNSLSNHGRHHNSLIVSDWPWRYNSTLKKWELKSDTIAFHEIETDTCKLKMELRKVNKGETLPNMCWRQINGASWTGPPTYCNFFAQTLAYLTFGKTGYDPQTSQRTSTGWYPWGSEMTANNIHDYMVAHPELFVDLKWQDCWKYISAGYVVYFVWRNPSGAGHIATGYPSGTTTPVVFDKKEVQIGEIAQAGTKGNTAIFQLTVGRPWDTESLANVKTFLYLGYLNF